jgi:hypothetical protein
MLTRRTFVIATGALTSAIAMDSGFGLGERTRFGGSLPIPRLIDAARQGNVVKLKAARGRYEFYRGKPAPTYGYSAPTSAGGSSQCRPRFVSAIW